MSLTDLVARRAYYRERARVVRASRPGYKPRVRPPASCHPDRLHRAKGLCGPCYLQTLHPKIYAKRRTKHLAASRLRSTGWASWQYGAAVEGQKGLCAICLSLPGERGLMADHDHASKVRRGLLCNSCNRALGLFRDSPEALERAAEYVRKYAEPDAATG